MMNRTLLQSLAGFVDQLTFDELPPHVIKKANDAWFDLVGCYYGALRIDETNSRLLQYAYNNSPNQQVTLWGTGLKASVDQAAMAEGFIGYYLEFDDGVSLGGHWASSSIPAIIANVEREHGNGTDVIQSLVCAYEVGTRISRLYASTLLMNKVHFPCTMGAFAASAGVAKARKLDKSTIAEGFSNGCLSPVGPYSTAISGAQIKNMYSGWPNYLGIKMMDFAELGIGGDIDIFESENGLGKIFAGKNLDETVMLESIASLGSHYHLMDSYCKPYPCCRWLHAPIRLMESILSENKAHQIDQIAVYGPLFLQLYAASDGFSQKVKAQYSIPYSIAALICNGQLGIHEYDEAIRNNADVKKMAKRIRIIPDTELDTLFPSQFIVRVAVNFSDGTVVTKEGGLPWGPDSPATQDELIDKFSRLVEGTISSEERDRWISMYRSGLETEGAFSEMLSLFSIPHI